MNPPEHDIERVLTGMRETPVPEGMEHRILAHLEGHALSPAPPRSRFLNLGWPKIAAGLSLAAAVVLAIVFTGSTSRHREHADHTTAITAISPKPPSAIPPTPTLSAGKLPATASQPRLRRTSGPLRKEAQATVDESHPSSYSAPLMPLTEQERLLLRIVHRRPPFELAQLTPVRQSADEEQRQVDFESFFEPPKTETDDATHQ
jgi:hypothetical protein